MLDSIETFDFAETTDESLKNAARNYLRAVEGDGPMSKVNKAKDRLLEIAILWAQSEAIKSVIKK